MKLKTMISFYKERGDIKKELQLIGIEQPYRTSRFYLIKNYADFLLKNITIGMLVPCDENGDVLEEPKDEKLCKYCPLESWKSNSKGESCEGSRCDIAYENYKDEYQKAKERILFKGFKVVEIYNGIAYSKSISDSSGLIHLFWLDNITQTWKLSFDLTNIESLTKFSGIELTETAIKEIGL